MQYDFYEILGIRPSASVIEIERAYRRISLKLHPDKELDEKDLTDGGNAFKWLTDIKNTLLSPTKRRIYDRRRVIHQHRAPGEVFDTIEIQELQWNIDCRCGGTYEPLEKELKILFDRFVETRQVEPQMYALLPTLLRCDSCSLKVEVQDTIKH